MLNRILMLVELAIHPDVKRLGGIDLVRARIGVVLASLIVLNSLILYTLLAISGGSRAPLNTFWILIGYSSLIFLCHRYSTNVPLTAAVYLTMLLVIVCYGISTNNRTLLAPGFLWFPVLMMPNALLCGRKIALGLSFSMLVIVASTLVYVGAAPLRIPFEGNAKAYVTALVITLFMVNIVLLLIVALYSHIYKQAEKAALQHRNWIQGVARMQELSQMSSRFASQTKGPVDVLETALNNLEELMKSEGEPRTLLPYLESVDASIRHLGAVSKSFSLLSRRYLEEGIEQTSINTIFQHVDTVYNAGPIQSDCRLHWTFLQDDIPIFTQSAKFLMLILSLTRGMVWAGGRELSMKALPYEGKIFVELRAEKHVKSETSHSKTEISSKVQHVFDPELNEALIHELCRELGLAKSVESFGAKPQVIRLELSMGMLQNSAA